MSAGDNLTGFAGRLIEPVERIEGITGLSALEDAIDRQARLIHVLHAQLDLIEQQNGRPPEAQ